MRCVRSRRVSAGTGRDELSGLRRRHLPAGDRPGELHRLYVRHPLFLLSHTISTHCITIRYRRQRHGRGDRRTRLHRLRLRSAERCTERELYRLVRAVVRVTGQPNAKLTCWLEGAGLLPSTHADSL